MVITMKTLVMFVSTVFFIVFFVDCHTTTTTVTPANTPGKFILYDILIIGTKYYPF